MLSTEGVILTWNQGARQLKGYAPHEIIGEHFERFYTEPDRAAGRPARNLAEAREHGRVEDEGWRVRKDGSHFWADVVITALWDEDRQLVGYAKVTRDLTERRQADEDRAARLAAERAARRIERLQAATVALAAASHLEEAAETLTDVAMRGVRASAGVVAVPNADGTALDLMNARGYPPSVLALDRPIPLETPNPMAYACRTRKPIFFESRKQAELEYPELALALAASPFHAWAAVPLIIDHNVIGIIGLSFETARALDADERGYLLALADVGAQAMDRARLYVAERTARAEAEAALRTQDEFL